MQNRWCKGIFGAASLLLTSQVLALEAPASQGSEVQVVVFYSLRHPPTLAANINEKLRQLQSQGWAIDTVDVDDVTGGDTRVTIVIRK